MRLWMLVSLQNYSKNLLLWTNAYVVKIQTGICSDNCGIFIIFYVGDYFWQRQVGENPLYRTVSQQ